MFSFSSAVVEELEFRLPRGYQNWNQCDLGRPFPTSKINGAGSYAHIFLSMKAQCDGKITEWWVYNIAKITGTRVHFAVWQPLGGGTTNFYLIGYNSFNVTRNGWNKFEVPYYERIEVRPDYVIGFHYDTHNLDQDKLIVPYADDSMGDIPLFELFNTILAPYGHAHIIEEQDRERFVRFNYPLLRNSRLPALLAHVVPDILPPHMLIINNGIPATAPTPTPRSTVPRNGNNNNNNPTAPPTTPVNQYPQSPGLCQVDNINLFSVIFFISLFFTKKNRK